MKKFTLSIFALFICAIFTSNAAVLTVSSNPLIKAQYTTFASAITASTAGDTIYIHYYQDCDYGNITLNKAVTVIGENWNVKVQSIYFTQNINMNNCFIQNLWISSSINPNTYTVNNISIKDCKISTTYVVGTNWKVYNNIILSNVNFYNNTNDVYVTNNFFQAGNNAVQRGSGTQTTTYVKNNIFTSAYSGWNVLYNITNVNLMNNIFYAATPKAASYCSFFNNLTWSTSQNTLPYEDNAGLNNISNQNPLFVNATVGAFDIAKDYRLAIGSPAINAGMDGTDIGVSGGLFPWRRNADGTYDMSGTPNLPQVVQLTVTPFIMNYNNQQLQIDAKAKKK